GAVTVRAGWSDNRSDSRRVQAEAGGSGEVAFTAPEVAAAPPVVKEQEPPAPAQAEPPPAEVDESKFSGWSPAVFYAGAGLTAVLVGVTVWSGIDTIDNPGADKVKAVCASEDCQLYQDGLGRQHRTNALVGVTLGVGAATAVIGIFATDWHRKKRAPEASAKLVHRGVDVAPWASAQGGGLQAFGRF
ncbi:MAG TPA: hypothetical protein VEQ59_14455, partial [Polyangiaceae bacterium]|nr:hypothetical protein [Polyangiaceae bacterium]